MDWFDRELKLICTDYFSIYNPFKKRWEIRRSLYHYINTTKWSLLERLRSSIFVRSCFHRFPVAEDLYRLRMGLYNARKARQLLREIDEQNRKQELAEQAELDYQHKAAAKAIWHHYKEPTVHLSGKEVPKET